MSDKKSWNDTMEMEKRKLAGGKVVSLFHEGGENAMLPALGSEYKAAATPANRELVRLWLIMGKNQLKPGGTGYWFFEYVHLDSRGKMGFDENGWMFTLRFSGMEPATVIVRGQDLMQISDYITLHRMAWIRVADEELSADEALDENGKPVPFITSITIIDTATGEVLAGE